MGEKTYINIHQFEQDCEILANKVNAVAETLHIAGIYGIPRGGNLVAMALSQRLDLPMLDCVAKSLGKILVVDDLVDSGKTMKVFAEQGLPTAALYVKPHSPRPTFYTREIDGWVDYFYEKPESDRETLITRMLETIGENPNREGLLDTPKRVVRMWEEIYSGYKQDPEELFKASFASDDDEMVIVKDIPFYSMCEHHMVPFTGKAHIGYLPVGRVIGLSKLARLVDLFARRLQIQEQMTEQIAGSIVQYLKPKGVMVCIEAEHLCMAMRGVKKPNCRTITSVTRGAFRDNLAARQEFLMLIGR